MRKSLAWLLLCCFLTIFQNDAFSEADSIARLYNFVPNTTIQSSQINGEFNQLVNTMNTKAGRSVDNTFSGNNTFSGANTFTGNNTLSGNTINEGTSGSGVTADSVRLKDGMVKVSGTPTENGEIGYTSNRFVGYQNGSALRFAMRGADILVWNTSYEISTNTTAGTASGAIYNCTGTITLSLQSSASNDLYFVAMVKNEGTGIVTIDPNSTETIDGLTTIKLYPGESAVIYQTSGTTNYRTTGRSNGPILITSGTASNVATVDITTGIDSSFNNYELKIWDVVPATNATNLKMRVSTDGGSSFAAGSTDYVWFAGYSTGLAGSSSTSGDSSMGLNYTASTDGQLSNSSTATTEMTIRFHNPSGTARYKTFSGSGSQFNAASRSAPMMFSGTYQSTSAVNGIRFFMSSGNISMRYALYGWRGN